MTKLPTLLAAGLLGTSSLAGAQSANLFRTMETLDAGNISAPHLIHGDMWWNPGTGTSTMQFPKGVNNQLTGVSAIWMGGRDAQQQLKVAAQSYRSKGSDFWPGPISSTSVSSYSSAYTQAWARIWKINSSTIDAFLQTQTHTVANTPAEILEWPGRGNPHAKGANGASVTANDEMAPFVDLNSNSIYEPLSGEYPKMKGSQMLWWILNDNALHDVSQTMSTQVEVRVSAYSYAKGSVADNIIFYEYDLLNNSPNMIGDFVFATMADLDIAFSFNDYTGFDSAKRLAVTYDRDTTFAVTRGAAAGYVLLDQPGDAWQQYTPVGAMTYYLNEQASPMSDPQNGLEYYRLMTGYNRAGTQLRANSNYAFDALDESCTLNPVGSDQRFVLASKPTMFASLARKRYAFALVAADSAGSCPDISFATLQETADTAYKLYWNPSRVTPSNPTSVPTSTVARIDIFPNPATQTLYVNAKLRPEAQLRLTNTLGATLAVPVRTTAAGYELDIASLPPGMYHLQILDRSIRENRTFIKQ